MTISAHAGNRAGERAVRTSLAPIATNLTSTSERMVSYRHQEHMWQTADGGFHLLVNRGSLSPGGLSLFSSYDGGVTWTFATAFAGTDDQSTGDGQLNGDGLSVIYPTTSGDINFSELQYDVTSRQWLLMRVQTVFTSPQTGALNPGIGVDSLGNVWAAFVGQDRTTKATNLRMFVRAGGGALWSDTGLIFGPTDTQGIERSARPVAIKGGMGMVYTVHEKTYWAARTDALPHNSEWSNSILFVAPSPKKPIFDIYASHFSVVGDDQKNVHFLISDDFNAIYIRYAASSGSWGSPIVLNSTGKAAYCQIGIVNGHVAAAYSMHSGPGQLMLSTDNGATFSLAAKLTVPKSGNGVSYGTPRIEMPTRSNGPLPILQQFEDNDIERLMMYGASAAP